MNSKPIYKSEEHKKVIMDLYQQKLDSLNLTYEEKQVSTFAGKTNVIIAGEAHLPPVVLFHGINAGTPLALESIKDLTKQYRIYGVDTVGQATRSAETRLPFKGDSYGRWIVEVLDALGLDKPMFVSASYGAFLLQRLIAHAPQRVSKAIFIVPSGFANGPVLQSIFKLLLPMGKYKRTGKREDLIKFIDAFYNEKDEHSIALQGALLQGVNIDTRRPTVLSKAECANFDAPVYALAAEHDIFFPTEKVIKKINSLFSNVKKVEVLQGSKHVPDLKDYSKITKIVGEFLAD